MYFKQSRRENISYIILGFEPSNNGPCQILSSVDLKEILKTSREVPINQLMPKYRYEI